MIISLTHVKKDFSWMSATFEMLLTYLIRGDSGGRGHTISGGFLTVAQPAIRLNDKAMRQKAILRGMLDIRRYSYLWSARMGLAPPDCSRRDYADHGMTRTGPCPQKMSVSHWERSSHHLPWSAAAD